MLTIWTAAQGTFDILGGILYLVVYVLTFTSWRLSDWPVYSFLAEVGIFASHVIWRLRHRKLVRAAKESGKSVEEFLAEKGDGKDAENETKASSVVQTPVEQGVRVPENHGNEAVASTSREDRDLERGPDWFVCCLFGRCLYDRVMAAFAVAWSKDHGVVCLFLHCQKLFID